MISIQISSFSNTMKTAQFIVVANSLTFLRLLLLLLMKKKTSTNKTETAEKATTKECDENKYAQHGFDFNRKK